MREEALMLVLFELFIVRFWLCLIRNWAKTCCKIGLFDFVQLKMKINQQIPFSYNFLPQCIVESEKLWVY